MSKDIASTPEESNHTSVKKRLESASTGKQLVTFCWFTTQIMPKGLFFELKSYLELVELIGCVIREDKRGHIDNIHLPLLERVNIGLENWLKLTTQFTCVFHGAVIRSSSHESYRVNLGRKRRADMSNCEKLLA